VDRVQTLAAGPPQEACIRVAPAVTMKGRLPNAERFRGSRPEAQAMGYLSKHGRQGVAARCAAQARSLVTAVPLPRKCK
jgi:hypothetical protein